MATMLTIGEFSRMTHLSVKALHHYHDMGVLAPATVDPNTGYRSMVPARWPRRRSSGGCGTSACPSTRSRPSSPPPTWRQGTGRSPPTWRGWSASSSRRRRRSRRCAHCSRARPPAAIELRAIPAATALSVRQVVDAAYLTECGGMGGAFFDALAQALTAAGLTAAGHVLCSRGDFFELERSEITAFLPVTSDGGGPDRADLDPAGRVRRLEIPAVEAAVAVHQGAFSEIDRTYGALGAVVAERAIGIDGPIREYYLVSSADTDDVAKHRTEVCWPVFRTGATSGERSL